MWSSWIRGQSCSGKVVLTELALPRPAASASPLAQTTTTCGENVGLHSFSFLSTTSRLIRPHPISAPVAGSPSKARPAAWVSCLDHNGGHQTTGIARRWRLVPEVRSSRVSRHIPHAIVPDRFSILTFASSTASSSYVVRCPSTMAGSKSLQDEQYNWRNFSICFLVSLGQIAFGYPASIIGVT